jgi:uncharacterized SAM-binding protein YcdF (DUF218 family)
MIRCVYRGIVGALALGFLAIVLAGALPVGPLMYRTLLVADPPRHADAIVVLGGGVYDENLPVSETTARLVQGLRLYHRGYAPLIILTGGNPDRPAIPESAAMARVAEDLGIPRDVLVVETVADRTATQAEAVARIARARSLRTILLVTSPEHSYRAARVFRKTGLDVVSTPMLPQRLPRMTVTLDPRSIVRQAAALSPMVYEYVAIALYWSRGWL